MGDERADEGQWNDVVVEVQMPLTLELALCTVWSFFGAPGGDTRTDREPTGRPPKPAGDLPLAGGS